MAEHTGPLLEGSLAVFTRGLKMQLRRNSDFLILGVALR